MLRTIIGSSNVYRFYQAEKFEGYRPYEMKKCTNQQVFDVAMNDIKEGKGQVIISVIENLLCDAVRDIEDPKLMNEALENSIQGYLRQIDEVAKKNPNVKFAIVQPTLRPLHPWFTENHEAFCRRIGEGIGTMGNMNVGKVEALIQVTQEFEADGVHLNPMSGNLFVNTILYNSDAFFNAQVINLDDEMNLTTDDENAARMDLFRKMDPKKLEEKLTSVERKLEKLTEDIRKRRINDSMVMARVREEIDFNANIKKEDRLIMTGLTSATPMPAPADEKKAWLKNIVSLVLNQIEPNSGDHIVFVSLGHKNSQDIPLAEVKLDSAELALKIRKQFAEKKKAGQDFGKTFITNSVTLATRVRVDIMRAIARKYTNETTEFFVSAYSSRPIMHTRPKDKSQRSNAYTFSDSISRYGADLISAELGDAYRRAGTSFKGQLQQNFVVLHDGGEGEEGRNASGYSGGASNVQRKRPGRWGTESWRTC